MPSSTGICSLTVKEHLPGGAESKVHQDSQHQHTSTVQEYLPT